MKKFFLIAVLFLFALPIQAQAIDGNLGNSINVNSNRVTLQFVRLDGSTPVKTNVGSAYITQDFIPARINNSKQIYPVRFNAADNLMEVKNEKSNIVFLDKNKDYIIKLNDGSNKIYQTITLEDGSRGFAVSQWVDEAGNSLYVREEVKFTPKKPARSSYHTDQPASYSDVKEIFYLKDAKNNKLIKLSSKKDKFYQAFGDRASDVKAFVKKERLKINKKEDLIRIMLFYTS